MSSLSSQLTEQSSKFERDLKRVEAEKEVILDDLDGLNEQYQQLQEAFDSQAKSLVEAQSEADRFQTELSEKEEELTRLHSHQQERRASLSKVRQCIYCMLFMHLLYSITVYMLLSLPILVWFLIQGVSKQISLEEKLDEIEKYPFTVDTCTSVHAVNSCVYSMQFITWEILNCD